MRTLHFLELLFFGLLCGANALPAAGRSDSALRYPNPPRSNQVDDYFGTKIADPYRELENADSPATQKWVKEENALTFDYLSKLPGRDAIRDRLRNRWDYEKYQFMQEVGGRFFYDHNTGLQNQFVLYVKDSLDGPGRVLIDPNTYRADGTAALAGSSASWDGRYLAYSIAQAGSDWSEWHVREVTTGKDLPDTIRWTKQTDAQWAPDNAGFYYSRYPEPPPGKLLTGEAKNQCVYFHRLGDDQSRDKRIYERPDHPSWFLSTQVTDNGRYLILNIQPADFGLSLISYLDLQDPEARVKDLVDKAEGDYSVIDARESTLYVRTTEGAPRGRIVAIDLEHPERSHWREIVPQSDATLTQAFLTEDGFVLNYLRDAHNGIALYDVDGRKRKDVALPGLGTANVFKPDRHARRTFYSYASFTAPASIYCLDLTAGTSRLIDRSRLKFNPEQFETSQVFYRSKDGTRVPMFLVSRKGLKRDGTNPVLLYGYGGFNASETPFFSVPVLEWVEMGGVYALANLRGGAEYGEEWHQAGVKARKQNVFDDFISAAEYLIDNKYTTRSKLAIYGASNGGLLIGAVLNQRPDLFGAAMPSVGVMDMLRFQKFGFGALWVGEYGSSENAEDFKFLIQYSPLHNIKPGTHYPPTLITTSDHDDRVMPGHSFKYAAALQAAQGGSAPILIRIETRAGHGAGKPTAKLIDEWADRLAFLSHALGMPAD